MCFQRENVSDIGSFRLLKMEFQNSGSKATIIYDGEIILRVSNQFEVLFGYKASEVIGKSLSKILTPKGLKSMTTSKPVFAVIHHQSGKCIPGVLTYRETNIFGEPYKVIQVKKLRRRGEGKLKEIVQVS